MKSAKSVAAKNPLRLAIDADGAITAIYSDELVEAGLTRLGQAVTWRISDVEPIDGEWVTTMRQGPVIGSMPISLGQFPLRSQALDAEVEFLNAKLFERSNGIG